MSNATLLTPEEVDAKLQKMLLAIDDLPSLPETLMEILKVLDDPDSGPADLGNVVKLDAPLMARILRLANSPYYSSRGDITDIHRCVTVLGYRTVRQVAICVSVATSVMATVAKAEGQLDYRELWRHSVVTAAIGKYLGLVAGYPDPEELFTAGLLHDMGKFVLEIHAPDKYWNVISKRREAGQSLVEAERKAFGFGHDVLGQAFGRAWRFPNVLTRCCGDHHLPPSQDLASDYADQAVGLISLGDYLANTLEPTRADLGFDPDFCDPGALHARVGLSLDLVEEHLPEIRENIANASAYLDFS